MSVQLLGRGEMRVGRVEVLGRRALDFFRGCHGQVGSLGGTT